MILQLECKSREKPGVTKVETVTAQAHGSDVPEPVEYSQRVIALQDTDAVVHDGRSGANIVLILDFDDV